MRVAAGEMHACGMLAKGHKEEREGGTRMAVVRSKERRDTSSVISVHAT